MAIVTSDFLNNVLTSYQLLFEGEFAAARNLQPWRDIAMTKQSRRDIESYNWLGTPPVMVDVTKGEVQIEGAHPFQYNIQNRTFKSVVEVKRAAFEDDTYGLISTEVQQLGEEAARHPGQLLFGLFISGGLAFDGLAFFADTRVIGRSANVDNIIAGGSDPTVAANFQLQLAAARAQMRLFQDDQGRPMNLVANTIVIPAGLEQAVFQALNANQGSILNPAIPATADGSFQASGYLVMVNPYLTDANDWYLMCRNGAIRPFIYQERIAPALEGITTPNSDEGLIRDRFLYAVRARYEVGYGDPRYAIRITNT
jgi:phage major head subunit gpT-like protein